MKVVDSTNHIASIARGLEPVYEGQGASFLGDNQSVGKNRLTGARKPVKALNGAVI